MILPRCSFCGALEGFPHQQNCAALAQPTPLPPEGVTKEDQQRASKWLARYEAGEFDLTQEAVEALCATTRIAATSAAGG